MPMLNPGGQGGSMHTLPVTMAVFSHAPESCRSVPHSYMDSVALHFAFCYTEYCGRLWLARFVLPAFIIALLITSLASTAAMAPHLSAAEQDRALQAMARNSTPLQIYDMLERTRVRRGIQMVNLTVVRRFLKGATHKRGRKETRGRKRVYSRRNVLTMNAARRKFIQTTKGTKQAKWNPIVRKARAPHAHRTTAARAFAREKIKHFAHLVDHSACSG